MSTATHQLSATDHRRLAGYGRMNALFDERTLDRALRGLPVRETSLTRILEAAAVLGIHLPPTKSEGPAPASKQSQPNATIANAHSTTPYEYAQAAR